MAVARPSHLSTKFSGTHDLSVAAVLELAERLQMLPKRVVLWGIDISHIDSMNHRDPQQIVEQAFSWHRHPACVPQTHHQKLNQSHSHRPPRSGGTHSGSEATHSLGKYIADWHGSHQNATIAGKNSQDTPGCVDFLTVFEARCSNDCEYFFHRSRFVPNTC